MDDNELQVDEDLQEIYADSQRFELAMQPKIRDAEMRKHHALAGQAEERRRLENMQQQMEQLEQQMVSWQSIYVIINIGILKCEKFKSDFYFHVCFKSKFSFITH